MQSLTINPAKCMIAGAFLISGCVGVSPGTVAPSQGAVPPSAQRVQIPLEVLATAKRFGYKPRMSGGDLVYCKTATTVGSHLPESNCIDEAHFDMLVHAQQQGEDNTRNTLDRLQRQPTCARGSGSC